VLPAQASPGAVASTSAPDVDYYCLRMTTAKAEAFIGKPSDATMSYAIKASESKDPDQRELAAIMFSYIGTPEATADLKELARDSVPAVADVAKDRLSAEPETFDYYGVSEVPIRGRWAYGNQPPSSVSN
jgi:hypothetical protein